MITQTLDKPLFLIDAFIPAPKSGTRRPLRDALLILLFSMGIAVSARISIPLPFTPVPITGQTFAVLLTGATLGAKRGGLALVLYLLEGASGLPVFAGGAGGFAKLMGTTGGYLLSYPFATFAMGTLAQRGWDKTPSRTFMAMLLSSLIVLITGTLWLSFFVGGIKPALGMGLLPFLPGDVLKAALAAGLLPTLWKGIGRRKC